MSIEQAHAKLAELIKDIRIAQFTTVEQDGSLRSRPMATQDVEFRGDLWFFTRDDSPKVQEFRSEQHVNVSYASADDNRFVSVSGRASLVKDTQKIKELWNPALRAWFPDGQDDPRVALIKVTVDHAEYWDAPASTMVKIAGFVKAIVTGESYDAGENKTIDFNTGEVKDIKAA